MNQDINSNPPIAVPSTEFGALLFAILPCLRDTYRPLASFAYHFTELSKLKTMPPIPSMTNITNLDALIQDRNIVCQSLSFYGRVFRMPLLSTLGTLLQGFQFYQTYKDFLPGLVSSFQGEGAPSGDSLSGLFSMLGSLSGKPFAGGVPMDMFSSFFSQSTGTQEASPEPAKDEDSAPTPEPEQTPNDADTPSPVPEHRETEQTEELSSEPAPDLYDSLYEFLTPEQKKIYEQLMHTDNTP